MSGVCDRTQRRQLVEVSSASGRVVLQRVRARGLRHVTVTTTRSSKERTTVSTAMQRGWTGSSMLRAVERSERRWAGGEVVALEGDTEPCAWSFMGGM